MPAEGATHRDSHELLDLAPMTVGEDAWVMPHGVLASIPPRRTGSCLVARVGSHPEAALVPSLSMS